MGGGWEGDGRGRKGTGRALIGAMGGCIHIGIHCPIANFFTTCKSQRKTQQQTFSVIELSDDY